MAGSGAAWIVSFFNQHYPDAYFQHLIENRGKHQYERIKFSKPGQDVPFVVIHKPTEENYAIVISPTDEIELLEPRATVHLGEVIVVLFLEANDSDGNTVAYIELHNNSVIVKITPERFTVFSADCCNADVCVEAPKSTEEDKAELN